MMGLPSMNCDGNRVSPIQLMILVSVRKEKKYGYEIIKDLREIFDKVWEPKTGVIYPAIKKLQEAGMLDSEMIDYKEHYSLSEEGRRRLAMMLPEADALASVVIRFAAILREAGDDLGVDRREPASIDDMSKDDKLRMLIEMRGTAERELTVLNEMIEKMAGGDDGQHNRGQRPCERIRQRSACRKRDKL